MAYTLGARRWWALGAITLAVLAAGLDLTVLTLALPTLAAALHASETDLQWFSAGYALVLAAGMLPAGLLGDRYGRKKVLLGALVIFGVGSLACAYAPTAGAFTAARLVLGLAGAGLVTMVLSALTMLFSEEERPRAVGIWAAANFLALPLGPLLGGWVLSHYWWGWVFLMNVPVVALALVAVAALLPEARATERPGLDPVGIASSSVGLAALTYGLIAAGQDGWGDARARAALLAGLLALAAFAGWERRLSRREDGQPLVDIALFRSRRFTWGTLLAGAGNMAIVGLLFTLPQYYQAVLGTDAQGAGVRLLPLIGGLVLGAAPADRLAARIGAQGAVALGFFVMAAGLVIGATTRVGASDGFVAGWTALCGVGLGLELATATAGALGDLPSERSGVGAALMQAVQKLGSPFGATILGSVLNTAYQGRLPTAGIPITAATAAQGSVFAGIAAAQQLGSATLLSAVRAAFVAGMDAALTAAAGIAVVGLVLALAFFPRRAAASAAKGREPIAEATTAVAPEARAPVAAAAEAGAERVESEHVGIA